MRKEFVLINAQSVFKNDLRADENLVWAAQPRQGLFLQQSDIGLIPFYLMWAGFAFFWEFTVVTGGMKGAGIGFALWGIPFCVIGAYLAVGRFFWESYQRKRTYYGITQKRVLLKTSNSWGEKLIVFDRSQLPQLTISTTSKGRTTIEFGPTIRHGKSVHRPPKMEQIENGEEAFKMLFQE